MRTAPEDTWQEMKGEGGRVERRHRGIVHPVVTLELWGALWRE